LIGTIEAKSRIERRHVRQTIGITGLAKQFYGIQGQDNDHRENSDDGNHHQEFDEGEGFV